MDLIGRRYLGAVLALALLPSCVGKQSLQRYTFEQPKLGTTAKLVFYAPDSLSAAAAAEAAWSRIDALNSVLSDYQPDSELNKLSATSGTGQYVNVSDDLWAVLEAAQWMAERTEGAFDVTIGSLTRVWRRAIRRQELPTEDQLADEAFGYDHLKMDTADQSVQLTRSGIRLDLGGIAKGYIADETLAVLESSGHSIALVDLGGDVVAGAPPPGKDGWIVDVNGESVEIAHSAIATSGDTYRYIEADGIRYSHIIDPLTRRGVTHRTAVSVQAKSAMVADMWASALSVLGEEASQPILSNEKTIQAFFYENESP